MRFSSACRSLMSRCTLCVSELFLWLRFLLWAFLDFLLFLAFVVAFAFTGWLVASVLATWVAPLVLVAAAGSFVLAAPALLPPAAWFCVFDCWVLLWFPAVALVSAWFDCVTLPLKQRLQ